ncbi:MAG: hypothetical protein JRJ86_08875 [Deltaproteobacteria bacterium]|nr:hypothetical protein [Deltaproteobacteria bacterium]MBW2116924.1 hypothetical protein [Deltaproteobacteria bacterium]
MNKKGNSLFFGFALVICLALTNPGCVTPAKQALEATQFSGIAKGYVFEIGEIKSGSFETAEYLPGKIRFELVKQIRERGLLARQSETEKRLSVSIVIKAAYPGNGAGVEWYSELISDVRVSDIRKNEVIANTEILGFSAWGSVLSDFIEITHAKEIADFLETIVR